MPQEASNSGMYFLGNKLTTPDMLLDPACTRPSVYELDPVRHMREQQFPYTRTVQAVPVNLFTAECQARDPRYDASQVGRTVAPHLVGADLADNSCNRPPAPCRQAWTSGPTFRYFRRSQEYNGPRPRQNTRDRYVGDNFYRPHTVEEQRRRAFRKYNGLLQKGMPRRGEW
jgi:hypothetical protein